MLLQKLQSVSFYYLFTDKTRVVLFLQIKPSLDNKGEKVEAHCFCKDCNLCLSIIFTNKTRVR